MIHRREFLKIMGLGTFIFMIDPNGLFSQVHSSQTIPQNHNQPPRILYGNKISGCSGWQPCFDLDMPAGLR